MSKKAKKKFRNLLASLVLVVRYEIVLGWVVRLETFQSVPSEAEIWGIFASIEDAYKAFPNVR